MAVLTRNVFAKWVKMVGARREKRRRKKWRRKSTIIITIEWVRNVQIYVCTLCVRTLQYSLACYELMCLFVFVGVHWVEKLKNLQPMTFNVVDVSVCMCFVVSFIDSNVNIKTVIHPPNPPIYPNGSIAIMHFFVEICCGFVCLFDKW